jgi:hypothetical protein
LPEIEELHKAGSEISDYEEISSESVDEDEETEKLKPFWKKTLRQEERMQDKIRLKRLEERATFLPNPRLNAERCGKT